MRIDICTIFPEMFPPVLETSMLKRIQDAGIASVHVHDFRDACQDRHRSVDDEPYGGGAGMVFMCDPVFRTVERLREQPPRGRVVLLSPQGRLLSHRIVTELAAEERLILLCAHYEGVDERIRLHLADDEVSIGDYVLTGGELPAMVVVDAVLRQLPGALGDARSARHDSFADGLLEHPHYTRPREYRGWRAPDVLLSGNHAAIAAWRRRESLYRTLVRRPDLLRSCALSDEDRKTLAELRRERAQHHNNGDNAATPAQRRRSDERMKNHEP